MGYSVSDDVKVFAHFRFTIFDGKVQFAAIVQDVLTLLEKVLCLLHILILHYSFS